MTQFQQDEARDGQTQDVVRTKRPISERKLRANRANAQRSTGPRTKPGKAVSRRNAVKHGILSLSIDLPRLPSNNLHSLEEDASSMSRGLLADTALRDIHRIWEKMARVLAFERDCMRRADGLEQKGRLVHRYERMLSGQLHRRIRERGDLTGENWKKIGSSL
jgi:hypothetical protein